MGQFIISAKDRDVRELTQDDNYLVAGKVKRYSSFNFNEYQTGRDNFGSIEVFGEEFFSPGGSGYQLHPHHNFVIFAMVLEGEFTHLNTLGAMDRFKAGDYYVFSAGSGGKHAELNIFNEPLRIIYIWMVPRTFGDAPGFVTCTFDKFHLKNKLITLADHNHSAVHLESNCQIRRVFSDSNKVYTFPLKKDFGVYALIIEGEFSINGNNLQKGDSIGIDNVDSIEITSLKNNSDLILVETMMP